MKWRSGTSAFLTLLALVMGARVIAHEPTTDGCGSVSSDDALELEVMRSPAIPITAGSNAGQNLPELTLDKHYAISLVAQDQMRFAVKPRRASRTASQRGGALHFEVPAAGRYRISITSRHWIDVVDGRTMLESVDHHGPGCDLVHKIVEFDLPGGRPLTLQISGQDDAIIGLAITVSPDAANRNDLEARSKPAGHASAVPAGER